MVEHSLHFRASAGICEKTSGLMWRAEASRAMPDRISQANRWSLMELPPFPACAGWLAGYQRASPSTPLDACCYVALDATKRQETPTREIGSPRRILMR